MNQKYISISIISLLLISFVLFLSGCGQQKTIPVDQTGSTSGGINTVVEGNNQFAFDLYSKFKNNPENENIFFSPYSISVALTMTYEGAKGKTAEEMQSVLHIPEDNDMRRPNFAAIYNGINKNDKEYKLSTANALWAQKDYPFLDDYLETVEKYYGGKATNLDMSSEPEKSRKIINDWVEGQTNDKIKDLIPPGVLPVRLVLTNAIYFKGDWIYQFDKKATRDSDFYKNEQERIQVPMMSMTNEEAEFNYAETEDLQILELPYKGEELSMLVLLPKENDIDSLEQNLNINKLSEWKNMLEEQSVDVFLPKFKFETKYMMAPTLSDMGMPTAFIRGSADFSGIANTGLFISQVIHQAFVDVNEEGTEAAAATAVMMTDSLPPPKPLFRADHPFIFIIQQKENGNILFFGRVIDPTK